MLCLTRYDGERIVIRHESGQEIEILINRRGRQVRLGFDAPHSFHIVRAELLQPNDNNATPKEGTHRDTRKRNHRKARLA